MIDPAIRTQLIREMEHVVVRADVEGDLPGLLIGLTNLLGDHDEIEVRRKPRRGEVDLNGLHLSATQAYNRGFEEGRHSARHGM